MHKFIILLFSILSLSTITKAQKPAVHTVSIKATQTADYCGGAPPSEDMLDKLATPRPLNETTFYIIKGKVNKPGIKVYKVVTTNTEGIISVKLPKGTYSILTKEQTSVFVPKADDENHKWDNACLKKMWTTPVHTFIVSKRIATHFNIHQQCWFSPNCCNYTGPIPG